MLEGDISQINLVERLVELWREQFTGALRFENDSIIKIIYFRNGDILSASTNDRADSLDEILMRAGKVSREHVKQALARRKENETLGDALLNLGFITRKELTWSRRVQAVGVIRSIVGWTAGSFTIVADYLPKRDEGTQFSLPQILVELIVTEQDRARFETLLDGGEALFSRTEEFQSVYQRLGLNEDADAIIAEIDGLKTAAEIAAASGKDSFNVYKLLYALGTLGVLSRENIFEESGPRESPQFTLDDTPLVPVGADLPDTADLWGDPAPEVSFDLEEPEPHRQPTLEVSMPAEPAMVAAPLSVWDEPDVEETPPPVDPIESPGEPEEPAWDLPPREIPPPAPIELPAQPEEERWGFDDAQLETAERGVITGRGNPPIRDVGEPPSRRYGLLIAAMVVFILAGAGWFGYQWWLNRETDAPAVAEVRQTAAVPMTPVPADRVEEVSEGITTAPPADLTLTTAAPAAVPVPVAVPEQAPVTAAAGGNRAQLDAAAREYAANPTGNYTVQIQILCDPGNLEGAIRTGGGEIWFVPQMLGDRACYRVFWGRYESEREAQAALAAIPAALRDRSSAVRPVPGRQ
ncbi:MAG TPA: DUF4388 domain-containing protein [Thermoanaerobaculia bacterium]